MGGWAFIITVFLFLVLVLEKPMTKLRYNQWRRSAYGSGNISVDTEKPKKPKYKEVEEFYYQEDYDEFNKREAIRKFLFENWFEHTNSFIGAWTLRKKFKYERTEDTIYTVVHSNFGGIDYFNSWNGEKYVNDDENIFILAAFEYLASDYKRKYLDKLSFAKDMPLSIWILNTDHEDNQEKMFSIGSEYYSEYCCADAFQNNWLFYEIITRRICDYYDIEYRFDFFESEYIAWKKNEYLYSIIWWKKNSGFDSKEDYERFLKTFETVSSFFDKCIDDELERATNFQKLSLKYNIIPIVEDREPTEDNDCLISVRNPDFRSRKEIERMAQKLTKPLNINF